MESSEVHTNAHQNDDFIDESIDKPYTMNETTRNQSNHSADRGGGGERAAVALAPPFAEDIPQRVMSPSAQQSRQLSRQQQRRTHSSNNNSQSSAAPVFSSYGGGEKGERVGGGEGRLGGLTNLRPPLFASRSGGRNAVLSAEQQHYHQSEDNDPFSNNHSGADSEDANGKEEGNEQITNASPSALICHHSRRVTSPPPFAGPQDTTGTDVRAASPLKSDNETMLMDDERNCLVIASRPQSPQVWRMSSSGGETALENHHGDNKKDKEKEDHLPPPPLSSFQSVLVKTNHQACKGVTDASPANEKHAMKNDMTVSPSQPAVLSFHQRMLRLREEALAREREEKARRQHHHHNRHQGDHLGDKVDDRQEVQDLADSRLGDSSSTVDEGKTQKTQPLRLAPLSTRDLHSSSVIRQSFGYGMSLKQKMALVIQARVAEKRRKGQQEHHESPRKVAKSGGGDGERGQRQDGKKQVNGRTEEHTGRTDADAILNDRVVGEERTASRAAINAEEDPPARNRMAPTSKENGCDELPSARSPRQQKQQQQQLLSPRMLSLSSSSSSPAHVIASLQNPSPARQQTPMSNPLPIPRLIQSFIRSAVTEQTVVQGLDIKARRSVATEQQNIVSAYDQQYYDQHHDQNQKKIAVHNDGKSRHSVGVVGESGRISPAPVATQNSHRAVAASAAQSGLAQTPPSSKATSLPPTRGGGKSPAHASPAASGRVHQHYHQTPIGNVTSSLTTTPSQKRSAGIVLPSLSPKLTSPNKSSISRGNGSISADGPGLLTSSQSLNKSSSPLALLTHLHPLITGGSVPAKQIGSYQHPLLPSSLLSPQQPSSSSYFNLSTARQTLDLNSGRTTLNGYDSKSDPHLQLYYAEKKLKRKMAKLNEKRSSSKKGNGGRISSSAAEEGHDYRSQIHGSDDDGGDDDDDGSESFDEGGEEAAMRSTSRQRQRQISRSRVGNNTAARRTVSPEKVAALAVASLKEKGGIASSDCSNIDKNEIVSLRNLLYQHGRVKAPAPLTDLLQCVDLTWLRERLAAEAQRREQLGFTHSYVLKADRGKKGQGATAESRLRETVSSLSSAVTSSSTAKKTMNASLNSDDVRNGEASDGGNSSSRSRSKSAEHKRKGKSIALLASKNLLNIDIDRLSQDDTRYGTAAGMVNFTDALISSPRSCWVLVRNGINAYSLLERPKSFYALRSENISSETLQRRKDMADGVRVAILSALQKEYVEICAHVVPSVEEAVDLIIGDEAGRGAEDSGKGFSQHSMHSRSSSSHQHHHSNRESDNEDDSGSETKTNSDADDFEQVRIAAERKRRVYSNQVQLRAKAAEKAIRAHREALEGEEKRREYLVQRAAEHEAITTQKRRRVQQCAAEVHAKRLEEYEKLTRKHQERVEQIQHFSQRLREERKQRAEEEKERLLQRKEYMAEMELEKLQKQEQIVLEQNEQQRKRREAREEKLRRKQEEQREQAMKRRVIKEAAGEKAREQARIAEQRLAEAAKRFEECKEALQRQNEAKGAVSIARQRRVDAITHKSIKDREEKAVRLRLQEAAIKRSFEENSAENATERLAEREERHFDKQQRNLQTDAKRKQEYFQKLVEATHTANRFTLFETQQEEQKQKVENIRSVRMRVRVAFRSMEQREAERQQRLEREQDLKAYLMWHPKYDPRSGKRIADQLDEK